MSAPSETTTPARVRGVRQYGFSVLVTGLVRMWRAWLPAVVWIVLNAVVQAGLVSSDPVAGFDWAFLAQAFASAVFLLLTGAALSAGALQSVTGPASFGSVMAQLRANFGLFAGWVVLQTIVVSIGYALWSFPGPILWLLTAFVPLAAIDGQRNALAANFAAIGSHPFRWLLTGAVIGLLGVVGFLLGAVNTFFVGGSFASLVANLVGGLFAWWFLTAWACLYLSRKGAAPAESAQVRSASRWG